MDKLIKTIKSKINLNEKVIINIIELLEDGATIPFIARYRKDMTSNATDETLIKFQEIYEYSQKLINKKDELKQKLKEKGELTSIIEKSIDEANTLTNLDDIYEPFKGVKNTRANDAIENNLEKLSQIISTMRYSKDEVNQKAKQFLNQNIKTTKDAIDGAIDIIALRYSQDIKTKEIIRKNIQEYGLLTTKKTKTFKEDGVYKNLLDTKEKVKWLKSHKLLAILRAVNEKELTLKIEVDEDYLINGIKKFRIKDYHNSSKEFYLEGCVDGLKRLLLPSLKRELISNLKEKANKEAIELFGKNLSELLMTPPLVNQTILGIDPGYKTGCKLAIIDNDGKYLDSEVIYLLNDNQILNSSKKVLDIIKKYKITAIAIGNGTASKETALFVSNLIKSNNLNLKYAVVSEIGASVYSASKIAVQEYPNLDVTIRGAISIAGRLRDPMATLVKIDPKSLGIGQYQHDLPQKELGEKLKFITSSLVNKVGVDINSTSYKLLSYISGISEKLALNIIEYRDSINGFKTKKELLKVKGLGAKTYEQSVGFIRIKDGLSYLDNTGIHPESYNIAKYIKDNYPLDEVDKDIIENISNKFNIGIVSLEDIIKELQKPGYDIREELEQISFCEEIKSIEELKEGDIVSGVVRNITDFGAFIDIGLKNDAMLHISQYSKNRINHLSDVMSINQQFNNLKIVSVDIEKNKIGLSLIHI
ncbi:MAG: Tex-like N-terminal domain-containing protein [Campylobacterota bacterium]|nr:Tex-like N-terminal domain-containing protein [Campylobacterota bacterium]